MCQQQYGAEPTPFKCFGKRAEKEDLKGITHTLLNPMRDQPYLKPEMSQRIKLNALFVGNCSRDLVWEGYAEYLPGFYSEQPRNVQSRGEINVFYATVSPMDNHGYFSFGTAADLSDLAVNAQKIFLEVNSTAPRTHGNCLSIFPRSQPFVNLDPITEVISGEITEIDRVVGEYIAAEIPIGPVSN